MHSNSQCGNPYSYSCNICVNLITATMTLDTSFRRQQVEGRGLRAEATPRTSTPYTERLAMLSNSGTFKGRGKNYWQRLSINVEDKLHPSFSTLAH